MDKMKIEIKKCENVESKEKDQAINKIKDLMKITTIIIKSDK